MIHSYEVKVEKKWKKVKVGYRQGNVKPRLCLEYTITRNDGLTFKQSSGTFQSWKAARKAEGCTIVIHKN